METPVINETDPLDTNTVQQTLCIPLWGRKIAAEEYPRLFPDLDAGRIVEELGVDLSDQKIYRVQYAWLNAMIRQYDLAWEINNYLKTHPRATVVELGAGLSCLRRQMANEKNPWYCLDMENVIALRKAHIPQGPNDHLVACDLNEFKWFDEVEFDPRDGIIFTAGGLFYYFEKEQVKRLFCAMAERFPGGAIVFDAVNAKGLRGVRAEVKAAGNSSKSFFSLEKPQTELKEWSERFFRVSERDYINGYLSDGDGYRQSLLTKILAWINRTLHMAFIVHLDFMGEVTMEIGKKKE